MIKVNIVTFISRPVEAVFDRLANINGYNDWMPGSSLLIRSTQVSDGLPCEGTRFYDRTRGGHAEGEIIEFHKPWRIGFRQTIFLFGKVIGESRPGYKLEQEKGNTRVTHYAEGNFFGLFRLFEPLLAIMARKERKRTLDALKISMESE